MTNDKLEQAFANYEAKLTSDAVFNEVPATEQSYIDRRFESYEAELDQRLVEQESQARNVLRYSMEKDPDRMAQVYDYAKESGVHPSIIEDNFDEVQKSSVFSKINRQKNPALTRFISDKYNADIAHDDIEALAVLEDHLGAFNAGIVSFPQMIVGGTAAGIEAGGRLVERALPDEWLEAIKTFEQDYSIPQATTPLRAVESGLESFAEYMGPTEQTYTTQLAGGLGQATAQIGAMLVAPQAAFPSLFAQNVSQQEQRREESPVEATALSDVSLIASGGLAVIERFGLEKLLDRIPPEIKNRFVRKVTDVVIGGGYEALTEVMENVGHGLIEYATVNPEAEIFKGVEEDAAVGFGVGAIIRALIPSYKGKTKEPLQERETKNVDRSQMEQEQLETTIRLLQDINLPKRDKDAMKKYVDELQGPKEIRINTEAFVDYEGDLPQSITDKLHDADTEVTISLSDFAVDVATNPELLSVVRPHLKQSENTLTQNEMDAGGTGTVEALMKQAEENAANDLELDNIRENVVSQLLNTKRVNESGAKTAVAPLMSYIETKAKDLNISPNEVFDQMGLNVKKMEDLVLAPEPPFTLTQDFGDLTLEQEVELEETGEKVTMSESAQRKFEQTRKRRQVAERLIGCLNG